MRPHRVAERLRGPQRPRDLGSSERELTKV
nr:MAG TPA: hypothetical protein [Caudoviricetes sp.]